MLTLLRVQNLKSVVDSGPIELRPLTFLMGPNSSGKSTLLQAILLAKQTVEGRDPGNPLVIQGDYVKLGSFRELVSYHSPARELVLEFQYGPVDIPRLEVNSITLRAQFSFNRKTLRIYPTSVRYTCSPANYQVDKTPVQLKPSESQVEVFREEAKLFRTRGTSGKFYDLPRRVSLRGPLPDESRLLSFLPWRFENQLLLTFYVGPLRVNPERTYVAAGEMPQRVGLQGEATFATLWASRWDTRLRHQVYEPTRRWLEQLRIAEQLELKRIGGSYFTCFVTDPVHHVRSNFADVGFGASQVLPAIVQLLYAPAKSTVILEQPEIHLHPRAQAALGDLLASQASAGKQLLVETHSEHLVFRVLRRIAEGTVDPDDVAIYYCIPTPAGTQVRRIPIDPFGRFAEPLPEGFFEQEYQDTKAHMEAVANRAHVENN